MTRIDDKVVSTAQQDSQYTICPATVKDAQSLPAIERAAGQLFRTCDNAAIATLAVDDPMCVEAHFEHIQSCQWGALVAVVSHPDASLVTAADE